MRISDWSSDVCSSDLIACDIFEAAQHSLMNRRPLLVAQEVLASGLKGSSAGARLQMLRWTPGRGARPATYAGQTLQSLAINWRLDGLHALGQGGPVY